MPLIMCNAYAGMLKRLVSYITVKLQNKWKPRKWSLFSDDYFYCQRFAHLFK